MNIGVVGSGKVGRGLGGWAAEAGHAVCFTSRREAHAREAARDAGRGARAADLGDLVDTSALILLTLPFTEVKAALGPVRDHLAGRVLVDVTNPITPDHRDLTIGHDDSGAEEIARAFPQAMVVKAFNAVFAEVYAARAVQIDGGRLTIFHAGDDGAAKAMVRDLIESLGLRAVDAGPLRNARYLEPLSLLNIHLGRVLGYGTHIGITLLGGH